MSVQLSMRGMALRAALERHSETVATVTATDSRIRITVVCSLDWTLRKYQRVLHAVQTAQDFGSSSTPELTMWAEYDPSNPAWQ
jgi:hypothetical protein